MVLGIRCDGHYLHVICNSAVFVLTALFTLYLNLFYFNRLSSASLTVGVLIEKCSALTEALH